MGWAGGLGKGWREAPKVFWEMLLVRRIFRGPRVLKRSLPRVCPSCISLAIAVQICLGVAPPPLILSSPSTLSPGGRLISAFYPLSSPFFYKFPSFFLYILYYLCMNLEIES